MPSCSRIRDFIINRDAGKWRAVLTLSLSPQDVDIPGIVTAAFPGSRIESISREWKMLETSYEAVIELPGSVRCLAGCGRKVRRSAAVYGASTVSAAFGM